MSAETTGQPRAADDQTGKRTRRALPISKRIARNGKVSYTFQIEAGIRPDGSRDRRRYTYTTLAEARREYARITTEAVAGTLVRRDKVTVGDFLSEWLDSRRVRPNTLDGYRAAPQAGHRPPRHAALTTPRHPTSRRAGDVARDRETDCPARESRTPVGRGAGLSAGTPERCRVLAAADHLRRARHQST